MVGSFHANRNREKTLAFRDVPPYKLSFFRQILQDLHE